MIFNIVHTTAYEYSAPAIESFTELRVRPRQSNLQKLSDEELRFLTQIRRYSSNLNDSDRKLLLAMVKKFAATATR